MIRIIAAMTPSRVIGNNGKLPWTHKDVPRELRWFQSTTLGGTVIMGRKTWDSLPPKSKPLVHRDNIIVSRTMEDSDKLEATVARSLKEALNFALTGKDIWIIGGAQLYASALPIADELYLTFLDKEFEGDTYFPQFEDLFTYEESIFTGDGWTVNRFVKKV